MTSAPQVTSIVSTRYAAALIDLAEEAKAVENIEGDLASLGKMIESSEDLAALIRSPLAKKDSQKDALAALAEKAKFHKLTSNFLGVLVANRRLYALESILKAARLELSRRRGEICGQVVTAAELDKDQQKSLEEAVSKAVGAQVSLDVKVDPSILGGMIVTVGSRMIDDSVQRKLERLRLAMNKQANQNEVNNLEEVG